MRIQDVMIELLLKQPFYGYFASSVTPVESLDVDTISMISSPSLKLVYNRKWYEALSEEQAVGAVIHELLHLILLHPYRKGNREQGLWVIACDMAVNEHLDSRQIPDDAVTVEKISKEIKEVLPHLKSAEFYYDKISQGEEKLGLLYNKNEIRVILKSGQQLKADNSVASDASEVNKNALKSMLSELIEQAQAEGEIPSGLSGFINETYRSGEINWRNVLKRFLSGKGKVVKRKTYKKESKRFDNMPGSKRTIGLEALLAIDESGSISDKQAALFYNEMLAIKKITGARVKVTQFDTGCTEAVPIEKYIRDKKRIKNGGTDFRPVFKMAEDLKIPLLIIFTDGDGVAPESADQRVVWVLTKGGKRPVEYGYSIAFDS